MSDPSLPAESSVQLPIELHYATLSYLAPCIEDPVLRESLEACCLASSSFRSIARPMLFRDIILDRLHKVPAPTISLSMGEEADSLVDLLGELDQHMAASASESLGAEDGPHHDVGPVSLHSDLDDASQIPQRSLDFTIQSHTQTLPIQVRQILHRIPHPPVLLA